MKSLLEVLNLTTDYLKQRRISSARRQAEDLIAGALNLDRLQIYVNYDRPLSEDELQRCRSYLIRRAKREPLQYILGEVEFYDCTLSVTPDVLIPRQETEILVDKIAKDLQTIDLEGKVLWDVCCGSGCIGIALKKKFPALRVLMSDLSPKALAIAESNAKRNDADVALMEGDLLAASRGEPVDFLVCNPPYVREDEFPDLDPEVKDHEPRLALVPGPTGLECYARIARDLKAVLKAGARCWFELGTGQGEEIQALFMPLFPKKYAVEKDWAGHDRFFFLEIE